MNKKETLEKVCEASRIQNWQKQIILNDRDFYAKIIHLKTLDYNPKKDDLKEQINIEYDYIIWNVKYIETLLGQVLKSD